jgi:hypothetical protein
MKRGPQQREKKTLSISGLLETVKTVFAEIPEKVKSKTISLTDALMSALAMFNLKSPSLLSFDKGRAELTVQKNLQRLFEVINVPSDTYMRELLDEVDPKNLRPAYLSIFHNAQRGKLLERYAFLNNTYLCLVDGSEIFNSEDVHCKNCCQKHHRDGRVTYHHQILGAVIAHPDLSQVIPLCPEPITKQDGSTKNDCERNAFHRFLLDIKREHPRLQLTMVSDALSATAPHIQELKSLGYDFIIVAKPDGNRSLYEWINGIIREVKVTVGRNRYTFRYVNAVPLNGTKDAPLVNFLECEWVEIKGRQEKKGRCGWVTSHEITDLNVYELMRGGRARWKVENETFNTLKNQGYQFEHNFGHGKKNLHTVFAYLMMLAFLIDQIQEAACGLFQGALQAMLGRSRLWERLRACFSLCEIESWEALWRAIGGMRNGKYRGSIIAEDSS